jgi:hypothetical protein
MQKPKPLLRWLVQFRVVNSRFLQQAERAAHISADKIIWTQNRSIDVTFRRKM